MRVAVIGLGKLGAPAAAVFAHCGHEVVGCDTDADTVLKLGSGVAPCPETNLQTLLDECAGPLDTTTNIELAAQNAEIVFVVVPTPSLPDGSFSDEAVRSVLFELAAIRCRRGLAYQVISVVSTVSPGTMRPLAQEFDAAGGGTPGRDIGLVYNPEFIALGSVIHDMLYPSFTLVGESDGRAGDLMERFYETIHDAPCRRMSWESAEIAKIALNVALVQRISYANTISEICERTPGASARDVLRAVGSDHRIGPAYLKSGAAYGGPCFPRDCRAFSKAAEQCGCQAWIADATDMVNWRQACRLADVVSRNCSRISQILVLGLTYKLHTVVTEESAGVLLVEELRRRGFYVVGYDPMTRKDGLNELVASSSVIVLMLPNPEHGAPLMDLLEDMNWSGVVIDCWGVVEEVDVPSTVTYILLGDGGDA